MRVFYALTFTNDTKQQLASYRDYVADHARKGRYALTENLHITLAFIGEVGHKDIEILTEVLEDIKTIPKELLISHFGQFKHGERGIVWLGIEKNPELLDLVKDLRNRLIKENITFDQKKFKAHITLGRQVIDFQTDSEMILKPYKARIASVALLESKRIGEKLCYIPVVEKRI